MSKSVLESVDIHTIEKEDAFALWNHVQTQLDCFDDFTKDRADIFLARLASPATAAFKFKEGLVLIENIIPKLAGEIHFYLWGKLRDHDIMRLAKDAVNEAFETYQVHRLNAYPPVFNLNAKRLAVRLGFIWEGRVRQAFLQNGTYHDVEIFGLLKQEWESRHGR